ncbi:MarR family winged helix-turn-helix transcriptional regulator [Microbacterium sp.]|uniref:MarR family winged helix-turn-helix transcriptional regulator n=1 Tax=Microbacterium sp. TaxID=51671 RepID=UPI002BBBEAED|nr:MarR family transcriptional regulator [Microbacterium sp.]HWK77624.1 MarR family transcriptional regulator [Microbacterium sp.]
MQYFSRESDLVDRSGLSPQEIEQCYRVLEALRGWQVASRALAEASKRYMKLNESDMHAIRMIIRATEQGAIVTPKDVAHEVGISSASTTKLVDRLVAAGHLVRVPHPHDRRTACLQVTESTRLSAHDTIGRQHARRFAAAAAIDADDREAVIRFLEALTEADTPQGELASS